MHDAACARLKFKNFDSGLTIECGIFQAWLTAAGATFRAFFRQFSRVFAVIFPVFGSTAGFFMDACVMAVAYISPLGTHPVPLLFVDIYSCLYSQKIVSKPSTKPTKSVTAKLQKSHKTASAASQLQKIAPFGRSKSNRERSEPTPKNRSLRSLKCSELNTPKGPRDIHPTRAHMMIMVEHD